VSITASRLLIRGSHPWSRRTRPDKTTLGRSDHFGPFCIWDGPSWHPIDGSGIPPGLWRHLAPGRRQLHSHQPQPSGVTCIQWARFFESQWPHTATISARVGLPDRLSRSPITCPDLPYLRGCGLLGRCVVSAATLTNSCSPRGSLPDCALTSSPPLKCAGGS